MTPAQIRPLWPYLASTDKPIVLYGMGNGADKILAVCERFGVAIADFFASDDFVRGHTFHGKRVLSYSEIREKYGTGRFIVLLSFASFRPDVLANIQRIAAETELYAPDVPVCGENLFDSAFAAAHAEEIAEARSLLADAASQKVYDLLLCYKLSGQIRFLSEADSEPDEVYSTLLHAERFTRIADLGAYNGDTIRQIAAYAPHLKDCYAMEPDGRNYRKLCEYRDSESRFAVHPFNTAAWSETATLSFSKEGNRNSGLGNVNAKTAKTVTVQADSLDNLLAQNGVEALDYIKFDIEGAEREAIFGCRATIAQCSPQLLISAYHRSEDLFSLPLLVHRLFPDYKLYLRKFRYIPAWDVNLLAIKP